MSNIPIIELNETDPRARGRTYGEAARERITGLLEVPLRRCRLRFVESGKLGKPEHGCDKRADIHERIDPCLNMKSAL